MGVGTAAKLFLARSLWQRAGSETAGRVLLDSLESEDETARTLAGMFLVQGGQRAAPLLAEALEKRQSLPTVITLVGDLGDASFEPELEQLTEDTDPEVARAAKDALEVLRLQMESRPSCG